MNMEGTARQSGTIAQELPDWASGESGDRATWSLALQSPRGLI